MADIPISTDTNSSSDAVLAAPANVSSTPSSSGVGTSASGHHRTPVRNVETSPGALERGDVPILPFVHGQGFSQTPGQIAHPSHGPEPYPVVPVPGFGQQHERVSFVDARTLHSHSSQNHANTYVDARQVDVSFQVQGVDPLVHQQVVSGVMQHAQNQHSHILHDHANAFQQIPKVLLKPHRPDMTS